MFKILFLKLLISTSGLYSYAASDGELKKDEDGIKYMSVLLKDLLSRSTKAKL